MKLRTWFWTLLSLILIVGTFSYGANNLGKYNFYYATHMKHPKNQYPFITALALTTIPPSYLPSYVVDNGDMDKQGVRGIEISNVKKRGDFLEAIPSILIYANSKTQYEKTGGTYYIEFSEDGYLPKTEKKKMGQTLYHTLNDMQDELKRNSDRPLINLQWIYNWYFKIMT